MRRPKVAKVWAWLAMLAVPGWLMVAPAAAAASTAAASTAAVAATAGCRHPAVHPVGPFRIKDDHITVVDAKGRTFISYGITVPGLSDPNFSKHPARYVTRVVLGKDIPKIKATAGPWCGNTVRLQVSQFDVVPEKGGSPACDTTFLNQALNPEVHQAELSGLVPVVNDTTESDPANHSERDPTQATFDFWNCVTRQKENWGKHLTYAKDPQLIFDVFNEPRVDSCLTNRAYNLNLWRNGGVYTGGCGPHVKYQGMDAVVYRIRVFDHSADLVWVEGPGGGNTLAGLLRTHCAGTTSGCLITASLNPIVYAIHHPFVDEAHGVPAQPSTWWLEFGYLINKIHPGQGHAPVVAGEWTNLSGTNAYCWPDAPLSVPRFLSYLQSIGVGMSAYQLSPPYLIQKFDPTNSASWTKTTFYPAPATRVDCNRSLWQPNSIQGPGADILAWFRNQD
jgi:hypothetical protein